MPVKGLAHQTPGSITWCIAEILGICVWQLGLRQSARRIASNVASSAAMRVRYGYRRLHVLVRREGWHVDTKRIFGLYRDLGLHLRNKGPERLTRPPKCPRS